MKNKYKIATYIVALVVCLIVIYLNLLSHEKTQTIYLEQTKSTIINLKKDFLKDTVNNMYSEIDALRQTKYNNYRKNTEFRLKSFQEDLEISSEKEFQTSFIDKFKEDLNSEMWSGFLWDSVSEEILYSTFDLKTQAIQDNIRDLKANLSSYALIEKSSIKGMFGVSKDYIDELVKEEIANAIRSRAFSNDSYIWINEVINYEGGKDYAIRRVHPNLVDTEGEYLSTDITDIKGNFPYLEELEGIKKNGELFFTYYFKKLESDDISEKLTYAKLYKDYDWIIAMGVHLDDIGIYTEKTNSEIEALSSESIIRVLRYIFVALLIGFVLLYFLERNYLSNSKEFLEKKINIDLLTKAYSRSYGEENLEIYFNQYKSSGENIPIMMFDIDDFKHINDNYGHEIGDQVLTQVVNKINQIIRSSDQLIRWGGDEFVGIFPGLREEHIALFGEKLLEGISSLDITVENATINTTISIGFSSFKEDDKDFSSAIKRADHAMYRSKKQGKNKLNL